MFGDFIKKGVIAMYLALRENVQECSERAREEVTMNALESAAA
ncbi:MAG: hypothetical protein UT59_C0068G0005, partial [candidate division CPR2 bacterium GW2011_GWD1_39_7]